MVTLRERVTQYGLIVNLPVDHTAASVNQAVAAAFATLPAQVKHTLTWDQGVEMARHRDLAKTIGCRSTSPSEAAPGSVARTRTTTASCASTTRRAPTCRSTPWQLLTP